MTPEEAGAFLREHPRAVLATRRRGGSPQLSPVVVSVGDDGRLEISTGESTAKVANIRRDPRVSICALSDGFFGPWAQVDGTAEVVPLPAAMELLVAYYRRLSGEHPDWDEYRQAMVRDQRVIVRVVIEGAGPSQGT